MMVSVKGLARLVFIAVLAVGSLSYSQEAKKALHWQPWSQEVFTEAHQQHKFVLLDLEAVWCHWCHVMDTITYNDPAVMELLQRKYLLVKVDQDSRPDISNRYQDYGWPATVVFTADGSEIVKRQGYIEPKLMASMLAEIIRDPSPGPSVEREIALRPATDASFSLSLLATVQRNYSKQYDAQSAGWGFGHKYLDADSYQLALRLAAAGDTIYQQHINKSLKNATALIDPVWGGAYQYSVDGVWNEPHFEKLTSIQDAYMQTYALAYAQTHDPQWLAAAQAVHRYVSRFLIDGPTGAVFVSQDADVHDDGSENAPYFALNDALRTASGVPRVDKHVYARENGWTITALADLYAVSGDPSALNEARRAEQWILEHRPLPGGGFRHDDRDPAGPFLSDTLAMGQAFLELYTVDANRADLERAQSAANFIRIHFHPRSVGDGFVTSEVATDNAYKQHADREENIDLVKFMTLLAAASDSDEDRKLAAQAMRYLAAPAIAKAPPSAGILLARDDFEKSPLHVTVLGARGDRNAQALYIASLRALAQHELIEWRDPNDPHPLPTSVHYPRLARAALFLCSASACSSPIYEPSAVSQRIGHAVSTLH